MRHEALCIAAVVGIVGSASCGPPTIQREPVFPVQGRIIVSGKPADGAVVCFHPLNDAKGNAMRSHAQVAADGTFSLTTYVKEDGAREGAYAVTVYWADTAKTARSEEEESSDLPPDRLKGRFANPQVSKLRATIGPKPTVFEPVDLESNDVKSSAEYRLHEKS